MAPQLAVEQTGVGEPLVLLHGIVADHRVWRPVVPELARERRIMAVDLPGFGASASAGPGFVLPDVAGAILAGLGEQGLTAPFDLVGHSLGGGVALQLAAQAPAQVRSLVLVAPAGLRPFPPLVAGLLGSRRVAGLLSGTGPNGPAALTISTVDLRPRLREVAAPIGVIWGERDRTVPISSLAALLAERPDARVIRLPETGHVPMVEHPQEFLTALRTLLAGFAAVTS